MYHTLIIVGNLGRDPEMRYTPAGTPVVNLNVATNRKYTNAEGQLVEETCWFRASAFGKQAENANQYLKQGSKVLIEGTLRPDPNTGSPRLWTRQDGTAGASYEVLARTIRYLSPASASPEMPEGPAAEPDEIPF